MEITEEEENIFKLIQKLFKAAPMYRYALSVFTIALCTSVKDGKSIEFLLRMRELIENIKNTDNFNIEPMPFLNKEEEKESFK